MEDTGGVGGWGGCSGATVGCGATANHLGEQPRDSCPGEQPRGWLGAEGGVVGVGQEFPGSLGAENLRPRHNGPRFQEQSELWFCGAGSAQRGWGVRMGPGGRRGPP